MINDFRFKKPRTKEMKFEIKCMVLNLPEGYDGE